MFAMPSSLRNADVCILWVYDARNWKEQSVLADAEGRLPGAPSTWPGLSSAASDAYAHSPNAVRNLMPERKKNIQVENEIRANGSKNTVNVLTSKRHARSTLLLFL